MQRVFLINTIPQNRFYIISQDKLIQVNHETGNRYFDSVVP